MDWMTFVTKLVDALAWPVAACVLLYWFRSDVGALIKRVTKVTTPVGSVEAEAREARKSAEQLEGASAASADVAEVEAVPAEYLDVPTLQEIQGQKNRLLRLARINPAETIKASWAVLHEDAERIIRATPSGPGWDDEQSLLGNLALYGLNRTGLQAVEQLRDTWTKSTWTGVSPDAAIDFVEATADVLSHLFSMAIHPSRNPGFLRPREG